METGITIRYAHTWLSGILTHKQVGLLAWYLGLLGSGSVMSRQGSDRLRYSQ
jgi:hypothetical protein